jgi:hypothetical protein
MAATETGWRTIEVRDGLRAIPISESRYGAPGSETASMKVVRDAIGIQGG